MTEIVSSKAIGELKAAHAKAKIIPEFKNLSDPRDEVLARFQSVFSQKHVKNITKTEIKEFLLFKNNRHWSGLHRMGNRICSSMPRLRKSLTFLLNEEKPIEKRLNNVNRNIDGMGKAIITAILLIVYPDNYGVWNNTSEAGLKKINLWPKFSRGESFGAKYKKVNDVLIQLRDILNIDLWTLDALWWTLDYDNKGTGPDEKMMEIGETDQRFGLERHLQEFLRDNWDSIKLGKEWKIFSEEGDDEAGYEYYCPGLGRIDILAKHRRKKEWLVIELKRDQSSDQTVGQVLRYIGYVKKHMANKKEKVNGLIICHSGEEKMKYALETLPDVNAQLYEVEFHLKKLF